MHVDQRMARGASELNIVFILVLIFTSFYHIDLEEMVTLCKYTVPCQHKIIGYNYIISPMSIFWKTWF